MRRRILQTAILPGAVRRCSLAEMLPILARPWRLQLVRPAGRVRPPRGSHWVCVAVQHVNSCRTAAPKKARQINLRLGYMVRSGINPMGMVDTLDIFVGQENLVVGRQDPYVRSHPLTRDRMRSVETMAMAHDDLPSDPNMVYWHARVVGKLGLSTCAFMDLRTG